MSKLHVPFFYSGLDKYLSLAMSLGVTAVVARLLTPQELGLFALVAGVVLVTEGLRDFGAGTYIVQERQPSREGVRTAFTVMFVIAALLAVALAGASRAIAMFYGEPRLVAGLRLASLGLIVGTLGAPSMAILRRDLDFRAVAIIGFLSGAVASGTTITLVLLGYGYISIILGSLTGSLFMAVAAQLHQPSLWVFVPCLAKGRQIAAFGGWVSATAVLNNLYVMLPNIILPRMSGFEASALFSRATQLSQLSDRLIVGAISPVILPAFANLARGAADLRRSYLHGLALITAVQWPALLGLAILAEPVVRIVLGPQWDSAAALLRILALAGLAMAPAPLTFPILVALGHARDALAASLISLSFGAVAFTVAVPFGLRVLALSLLLSLPIQMFVALVFIRRRLGFAWGDLLRSSWHSACCALVAALPPLFVAIHVGFAFSVPLPLLLLAVGGGVAAWLAGLSLTGHPILLEVRNGFQMATKPA